MSTELIIGGLLVGFGLYSLVARFVAPHHLGKLEPMKRMWGEKAGLVMHVVAYTVLPLIAGALMVFSALSN